MADSESCRILLISSSLPKGLLLVQKLKELSSSRESPTIESPPTSTAEHNSGGAAASHSDDDDNVPGLKEPLSLPWTISNRYYAANVHFSLNSLSRAYPAMFDGVPAVILAWTEGEPIADYMKDLQKAMGENEPEIMLGVRLPAAGAGERGDGAEARAADDDEESIDSLLISYGFEYIDASRPYIPSRASTDDSDDVPNLPRVLDALSTHMWPSMSMQTTADEDTSSPSTTAPSARSILRTQSTLEHIINRDPMAILQALEELDSEFSFDDDDDEAADSDEDYHHTLKELAALERSGSDEKFDFDLTNAVFTTDIRFEVSSPTTLALDSPSAFGVHAGSLKPKVSMRFEDDFSAFVTAPPEDSAAAANGVGVARDLDRLHLDSGRDTPDHHFLHSPNPSTGFASSLYHSLGSVSDLGDMDSDRDHDTRENKSAAAPSS